MGCFIASTKVKQCYVTVFHQFIWPSYLQDALTMFRLSKQYPHDWMNSRKSVFVVGNIILFSPHPNCQSLDHPYPNIDRPHFQLSNKLFSPWCCSTRDIGVPVEGNANGMLTYCCWLYAVRPQEMHTEMVQQEGEHYMRNLQPGECICYSVTRPNFPFFFSVCAV